MKYRIAFGYTIPVCIFLKLNNAVHLLMCPGCKNNGSVYACAGLINGGQWRKLNYNCSASQCSRKYVF